LLSVHSPALVISTEYLLHTGSLYQLKEVAQPRASLSAFIVFFWCQRRLYTSNTLKACFEMPKILLEILSTHPFKCGVFYLNGHIMKNTNAEYVENSSVNLMVRPVATILQHL